ncbi:unnamed protein product [Allacma fusca]|uniref:Uncharacterized protein n=1 Tax=Allacma fusca TaxID=39272 RepID=A0A8J2KTD2_9HEXA|nr:unnamed protein product [Allacma fusca]
MTLDWSVCITISQLWHKFEVGGYYDTDLNLGSQLFCNQHCSGSDHYESVYPMTFDDKVNNLESHVN